MTNGMLVEIAVVLYWSMIESGLALIAACLPILRYLFRNTSEIFIRNARSIFSLHSLHSQQTQRSTGATNIELDDLPSIPSWAYLGNFDAGLSGAHTMRDLEAQGRMPLGRNVSQSATA